MSTRSNVAQLSMDQGQCTLSCMRLESIGILEIVLLISQCCNFSRHFLRNFLVFMKLCFAQKIRKDILSGSFKAYFRKFWPHYIASLYILIHVIKKKVIRITEKPNISMGCIKGYNSFITKKWMLMKGIETCETNRKLLILKGCSSNGNPLMENT